MTPSPSRSDDAKRRLASHHRKSSGGDGAEPIPQLDLFPVAPVIDVLDPRRVVGTSTTVEYLVRVRFRPDEAPHLVFHDRHGWYCETHGATCKAVRPAQAAVA